MKSTGIVRKLDNLGRIVIPKEVRRSLGLDEKDPVEIFVNGEQIILQKYSSPNECMITGEVRDDNLVLANGQIVLSPEGAKQLVDAINKKL
ncbi:transition state regulatory protein AbrB [Gracilibacillus boraciitolerans JCM 21714]|uniref:Transition state regulatory protein AbrB n=1 Tax=Gracilibacillus boraciitolerans JCM 21714 TaxID=1298598 RepID=W4VI64_9BACI|nr:AbrB/MazE/SpoVT family DNA-binding domain-containing protein [Gracilibacillus boraciitolerans]GAE92429.1 transition state regulatory protein AbrB [Gracilibacillus boraciitolerans JCM 21714]